MATDEMRKITSDKWTDDIWGVATAQEPLTKMFFYFGRDDHWVAEKTRDEIIDLRDGSGPKMVVCEEGLPHAFCLSKFFFSFSVLFSAWLFCGEVVVGLILSRT